MMTEQVDKLIGVLEKLERQYEQLLVLLSREKQATLISNPEAMNSVVTQKQELMAAMAGLERQRQVLLQQMAAQLRLPLSDLNLSKIAENTNDLQAFKVNRLGHSLAQLLEKVQMANEENRALVQHCLGVVQNTLGFFKRWLAPASVYGNQGRINDGSLSGKLLSGVV